MIRLCVSLALLSVVAAVAAAQQPRHSEDDLVSSAVSSLEAGDTLTAIDMLERALTVDVDAGAWIPIADEDGSIAALASLYRSSDQLERGIAFYSRMEDSLERAGEFSSTSMREQLISLLLAAGRTTEVIQIGQRQVDEPDVQGHVTLARAYALRGESQTALEHLRAVLDPTVFSFSTPARILVHPELWLLESDTAFALLVTDSREAFRTRFLALLNYDSRPVTEAQVLAEARRFADVHDDADARALDADTRLLTLGATEHATALLELMRTDTTDFLRANLAILLLALHNDSISSEVARIIADADFRRYPVTLALLAAIMAREMPAEARPLLRQLLAMGDTSVYLSSHWVTLQWPNMVAHAFASAESELADDLLSGAQSTDSRVSRNALLAMVRLLDPRSIALLSRQIRLEHDTSARQQLVELLHHVPLPEMFDTLRQLRAEGLVSETSEAIDSLERAVRAELSAPHRGRIMPLAIRRLLLTNMEATYGLDVSFMPPWVFRSMGPEDLPGLLRVRAAVMGRFSDEGEGDYETLTRVLLRIRWLMD